MARIAIIDDHPSTRDGLSTRIMLEPELHVCGEADSVESGLKLVSQERPDLAVIDISLKVGNGIDLIKQISSSFPQTRTLAWSMYDDSLYAERALRAGAMGFINKEHVADTIIGAIKTILSGRSFFSPKVVRQLSNQNSSGNLIRSAIETLSDRELETFRMIGLGHSTVEIAQQMGVRPKTVETYRTRVKEKLGIDDISMLKRDAVVWVLENG